MDALYGSDLSRPDCDFLVDHSDIADGSEIDLSGTPVSWCLLCYSGGVESVEAIPCFG